MAKTYTKHRLTDPMLTRLSAIVNGRAHKYGNSLSNMLPIIVGALFILRPPICLADDWSTADTQRQLIYTSLTLVDMGQTMDIKNHDDIDESAPLTRKLLGRNPERGEIALYFSGLMLGHYAISRALKPKHRKYWQYISIGVAGGLVANNFRIGLKVDF